jgi:hypothetical protein
MGAISSWRDHEARRRGVFREVNEQLATVAGGFAGGRAVLLLCECGDADCVERFELSMAGYAAVRDHPRRYVVRADHENPELEVVVSEGPRVAVVETLAGRMSRIPEDTDPRRRRNGREALWERNCDDL